MKTHSARWSSKLGFILACVGSAVGLGNLWKFPYITYENGGGAFVIVYLISIFVVGLPIMISEMILGREVHSNIFRTFKKLSKDSTLWKGVGVLCLLSAFTILSFYMVVAGWTLYYFYLSISGSLVGLNPGQINSNFGAFVQNGPLQVLFHTLFTILTTLIVFKGTKRIEQAVKILMPTLFFFILVLMGISLSNYGASDTINFLFTVDFSKLTGHAILEAIGHSFFTLSLGMGIMIIYGSYLSDKENIISASLWITFLDTLVALCACFMIYPIIFGPNMPVSQSSSILFTAISYQFHQLPMGQYVASLFYLLVGFAALSSTISLLEPIASFIEDEYNIKRNKATITGAAVIWLLGVTCALSNGASGFFTQLGLMDNLDSLSSKWLLPLGGIMISLFCGYKVAVPKIEKELEISKDSFVFKGFLFCVRFLSPAMVMVIFIMGLWQSFTQ